MDKAMPHHDSPLKPHRGLTWSYLLYSKYLPPQQSRMSLRQAYKAGALFQNFK